MMESLSLASCEPIALYDQVSTSVHVDDPDATSSVLLCSESQLPAKKPIRQWAAWTRLEEESFFNALRQFGKNFEKITRRVQSKNKDQVRHYYYRLVRRMNKLLGPELFLDSKNSKDTNAAMLRWWSLLEKYSCKASKLHLKPRRYKLFIEALESQLMKDKKKNMKKRSMGDTSCLSLSSNLGNHDRQVAGDSRMLKFVLVDNQNMEKYSSGKGSIKRNPHSSVIRINKGEATLSKPTRQRRKQGVTTSTAYKRWEKEAIAGVSLVADAAEHLERASTNIIVQRDQEFPAQTDNPESCYCENTGQMNGKLKLQLFPIDDSTRRALEMDKHNPYLELTLSTKKKISSILEHLNKKWGNSSVARGVLILFPYCAHKENLRAYKGWTQDSVALASEVYNAIGSPTIFRLRYGWFSSSNEFALFNGQTNIQIDNTKSSQNYERANSPASGDVPHEMNKQETLIEPATQWSINEGLNIEEKHLNADIIRVPCDSPASGVEWADSLTNISVGDLLSDLPPEADHNVSSHLNRNDLYQSPFSCDSFDAAIAAHLLKHQKMNLPSVQEPNPSSIWDAEETCDAFSFRYNQNLSSSPSIIASTLEENKITKIDGEKHSEMNNLTGLEQTIDDRLPEKENSFLTDIFWPDSLGPLDLELPLSKYQGTDPILSDSFSSLNRLFANSLDSFQNCTS